MLIEKSISYQIETQFPAIYRENGRELIELVKAYYEFMETTENQSIYNSRRMFDYRDIDSTLERMLLFFKKKYLSDLPLNQENIRFITKKVLDLYRKRGSEDGLKLFFRMFYDQDIKIYYPSVDMLKPSSSEWKVGRYLQMVPNTDVLRLRSIIGKKIIGSLTKAEAYVEKINFFILNNTVTPVIFLARVSGSFNSTDEILSLVDGELSSFGRVNGSLDSLTIDPNDPESKTGYSIGDILECACSVGGGARVVVTSVSENFTGEIIYDITDSGFGYTEDNTLLLVSNQTLFLNNTARIFNLRETLEDQFGNRGIVIGQNDIIVGVKMEEGDEFTELSVIQTVDRGSNITIPITEVVAKNDTSPGLLYPELLGGNTAPEVLEDSVRAVLENIETVSLVTDIIGNFLDVQLDAANYNLPPALAPMSGIAATPNINSTIESAFDLTPIEIGSILRFDNTAPGFDYTNQVFAIASDPLVESFNRQDQVITIEGINSSFEVGQLVSQGSVTGIIRQISGSSVFVRPYSYYGFSPDLDLTYRGANYNITSISIDYGSNKFGFNAVIDSITDFAVGKVETVQLINSGFGYVDGSRIRLRDANNVIATVGIVSAKGQGISEGYWKTFDSQLNIYDNKRIQDSFFYQDYAYEITSEIDINTYEPTLKRIAHLSGTKVFGKIAFEKKVDSSSDIRTQLDFG